MEFNFTLTNSTDFVQYDLVGDLMDKENAEGLIHDVEENLDNGQCYFVFNLEGMNYLNSTGLGVFIALLTKARNAGGELIVCNIPQKINQLLLITKLNTVFNVAVSIDEAIELIEKFKQENFSQKTN